MSRLVIDARVHPQHFAPGFLQRGERFAYDKPEDVIMSELPLDNSRALPTWTGSVSMWLYDATPPLEPPKELPLHIDWNLRQVMNLEISEEDRAKVLLGLNMARLGELDIAKRQE